MRKSQWFFQSHTFVILVIFCFPSLAADNKSSKPNLPAVLKADQIDADRTSSVLNAIGNVELTKNGNTLFADQLIYDKGAGNVRALGNIKIKNYDIGNLLAKKADMKSDFKSGSFSEATIIFNDGSYIKSPKITRNSEVETVFAMPIFSLCPNDDIKGANLLAGTKTDAISIASNQTIINKTTNTIKTRGGVIRLYDFPVFYTPYLSTAIPSSTRKSGFLPPSYVNSTKLGSGFRIPYYFNIAPNKDLDSTLQYNPSGGHLLLDNRYRHLLKTGLYNINLELANNEPKANNLAVVAGSNDESTQKVRWYGTSKGDIILPKNLGIDFNINNVGDKNYLRDYHNQFLGSTTSEANLDYIKDRDYASIKTVKIQELEVGIDGKETPFALPIINYSTSSKPQGGILNQTYLGLFNSTVITRANGLQYRRASFKPEVVVPYNLMGNLFALSANVQGDFYNLENNFTITQRDNNFNSATTNYRPEASLKWSLPMVSKYKTNTIILEPLANIVISSYKNNFNKIPNEDSGNTELTQNNLFLSDRFTGFDRNENGKRLTYGFRSYFFNEKVGQFNLGLGQSWRGQTKSQDIVIRGFNDNNKSNIVGALGYKVPNIFSVLYNFQLNESNYRNDTNEVNTALNFGRFNISSNYILIRRTLNNLNAKKQLDVGVGFQITDKLLASITDTHDLVTNRAIVRKYGLGYNGCCVTYSIFLSENNPTALAKPQKSYNVIFTIKNL